MIRERIKGYGWKVVTVALLFAAGSPVFTSVSNAAFEELITTGARAQGMGEAFCGIGGDASGILINPACIGLLDGMQASFTGSFPYLGMLENDMLINSFGVFATPIMKGHTIGGGMNFFQANKYNELAIYGTYAYQLFDNLTIAGTCKYLSWDSVKSNFYSGGNAESEDLGWGGISVDAGLFFKPAKDVGLGFALTDINQPNMVSAATVGKCTDPLPLGIRAGFSFTAFDFLVDFDYVYRYYSYIDKTQSSICLGLERDIKKIVGVPILVRGGVTFLDMGAGLNFSAGASYKQTEGFPYQIDYALNMAMLDAMLMTHRFSFSAYMPTFEELAKNSEAERAKQAEEERIKKEEQARLKAEAEQKRQELAEARKKEQEEAAQKALEAKIQKEQEQKEKADAAEQLGREAEKLAKEAELAGATDKAVKLKAEAESKKQEAEKVKAEAESAKNEAGVLAEKEQQAKSGTNAQSVEVKAKFDALAKENPKVVIIRDSVRGTSVSVDAGTLFPTGRSTINAAAMPVLDKIAAILGPIPDLISVEGHTDSIGNRDANVKLSTARAEAAAKYLAGKGVASERISSSGFGPERPVAPNTTKEGREQNRRVEIIILK